MNAYWIKVDIDGTGEKWRLAVKRDDNFYFPAEDFEDAAENYCESAPIDRPGESKIEQAYKETIRQIVDGELWAGHVSCFQCDYDWIAAAPWRTKQFECPKCGKMSGVKIMTNGEEMVNRIVTALVDCGGAEAKGTLNYLETQLHDDLQELLVYGVIEDGLRALNEMRPICQACNGQGGDCDAGDDGHSVSWMCEKCGGTGRDCDAT